MRYAKEFLPWQLSTSSLGQLRFATITTPKSWERYGIHALEGIYPIVGPGFTSVQNVGTVEQNLVVLEHRSGVKVVVAAMQDMYGAFGKLQLAGTKKSVFAEFEDTFYAFRTQLAAFITYLAAPVSVPSPSPKPSNLCKSSSPVSKAVTKKARRFWSANNSEFGDNYPFGAKVSNSFRPLNFLNHGTHRITRKRFVPVSVTSSMLSVSSLCNSPPKSLSP